MHLQQSVAQFFDSTLIKLTPLVAYLSAHQQQRYLLIVIAFALLSLLILRHKKPPRTSSLSQLAQTDIHAIAGDDVISTQLDLAKAYIEMNQKKVAKEMLDSVVKKGNSHQKTAARHLIQSL